MRWYLILILALGLMACGDTNDMDKEGTDSRHDSLSKDEAAVLLGKGDMSFDPCEYFYWYDDGVCDEFCPLPDPDCEVASGECQQNSDCQISGCSGQLCGTADNDLISTCEYLPEYACYGQEYTQCGCFDGQCGWEQTDDLVTCLEAGGETSVEACPVPQASAEICIQVIAYGTNPDGTMCCEYPNPCLVPEGWIITYDGCGV